MNNKQQTTPIAFSELLGRIVKVSLLILASVVCLYMFLGMLGYDSKDPGWSHLGYQPEVQNWTGRTGAWLADLMFSFLGLAAWLIPVMILIPLGRYVIYGKVTFLDSLPFGMVRFLGVVMLLAALCGLLSIHISNQAYSFPFTTGGLIGEALSDWMVSWFSILGSTIVLLATLFIGLTFYVDLSFVQLVEGIGSVVVNTGRRVQRVLAPSREHFEHTDDPVISAKEALREKVRARFEAKFSAKEPEMFEVKLEPQEPTVNNATTVNEPIAPSVPKKTVIRAFDDDIEDALVEEPPIVNKVVTSRFNANDDDEPEVSSDLHMSTHDESNLGLSVKDEEVDVRSLSEAPQGTPIKKGVKIVPLAEAHQPMLESEDPSEKNHGGHKAAVRQIPSMDLLDPPELQTDNGYTAEELEDMSRLLETKLKDFGVVAEVVEVNPGPVITRFELQPAPGVKASKITNLAKDLARSMAVSSVRVVEVIPGKSVVGVEIPNASRQTVRLSEVLNSKPYIEASSKLTLGLGNDIAGNPVVTNLAKMPHLLVAGTTGSGKSVGVNAMLLSLLFKATPDEVRLMMVDPKMLELSIYEGIPHLLTPVITDMKEAAGGLRWCVAEMERRYRLMAKMGVRNIAGYNEKVTTAEQAGDPLRDPLWKAEEHGEPYGTPAPFLETLPYIVVVIDEFADMMMIVGKKVEELIARIAQKARAAGIHLILATQRPSVDVITGLIKANVPTRIAFQVSSKIDSRTILDQSGAENLLGYGDMLYLPAGTSVPNRVHGAFVSDDEVHRVVEAWKKLGSPVYIDAMLDDSSSEYSGSAVGGGLFDDEQDPLYDEAIAFVTETRKASISSVQRRLKIGYNRAARMIETMEAAGVVTEAGSNGQREVLAPPPIRD